MKYGFTTGSCAAAAAKAAAYMLLFQKEKREITIQTPKGILYKPQILEITRKENCVSCAVRKESGDDPDITNRTLIFAEVGFPEGQPEEKQSEEADPAEDGLSEQSAAAFPENRVHACGPVIRIEGGIGVGRVTKPGLDQPVGNAAINHVPREMITHEVEEICRMADFKGTLQVTIYVPDGEKLAEKTFNPRLGIVGGISIIGTSGIVEPMSKQALLDTIRVELRQKRELGYEIAAVSPGNYGLEYMKRTYGYDLDRSVKCSNFIGDSIDMAAELGFSKMLLTGHIGKLIKVSGGIMNTHSREGDCRMELMAAAALRENVPAEVCRKILDAVVTEEGVRLLEECGKKEAVMENLLERILFYLRKRANGRIEIECVMYSNEFGELARSKGAEEWLILLAQEQERRT